MTRQTFARLMLLSISALFLSGSLPQSPTGLQQELDALTKRGFTVRWLDNDVVELTDPMSGEKHLKSLRQSDEAEIRNWAASRGIPILEIDPSTVDTNKYTGWYHYWTTVPLGNSIGAPLIIGNANRDSEPDVYGGYLDTFSTEYQTRVYEIDATGNSFMRFNYIPRPGVSRQLVDVDKDSFREIAWSSGGMVSGYEQLFQDSLPLYRRYEHERHYHGSDPGYTGIFLRDLDEDSLTDFLYQGTGPDPNDTNIAIPKTYVAEYDPVLQDFVRVWSTQFVPGSGAAGFSVGDFDKDGSTDFVASHGGSGRVFVAENIADNEYVVSWQDSTPFVNLYYHGSGDVDNDGVSEFFTGATMSNGNWAMMYEADGDDVYSPKLLFHLLAGGVFAEPIYTAVDLDGDGTMELAMLVGVDLFVFKSSSDNEYYLWYLRKENTADAVAFYDFNRDDRQDVVISKFGVNSQGRGWTYADIYLASKLVSVSEEAVPPIVFQLLPNYPNPFNPKTTIEFAIARKDRVTLTVHNLLGQRIVTLVDAVMDCGSHKITWDAVEKSSGVYLCRLEFAGQSLTRKLLLVR